MTKTYISRLEDALRSIPAKTIAARAGFAHKDAAVNAFVRALLRRPRAAGVESTRDLAAVLDEWSGPRVAPVTAVNMVAEAGWDSVFKGYVSEMGHGPDSPDALTEFYLLYLAAAVGAAADTAAARIDG